MIEPVFVRPFTAVESGRNDGNPVWSRSGMFLSFERSIGEKKELRMAMDDGLVFQTVYHVRFRRWRGHAVLLPRRGRGHQL